MKTATIDQRTLEQLVEAGVVRAADVIGQPGGWGVIVTHGQTERALAAPRGAVRKFRKFRKFERPVGYLKGIGISEYHWHAAGFEPTVADGPGRPDAAARLCRTHEAAEHDAWFRAEVERGVAEAEADGAGAQWLSSEEAMTAIHI